MEMHLMDSWLEEPPALAPPATVVSDRADRNA